MAIIEFVNNNLLSLENGEIYYNIDLIKKIEKLKIISQNRDVVFLCVGNSKVWYDSFGPMIGTFLQYVGVSNYVYGNLKSNVNNNNIQKYVENIYKFHYNPFIVVFDNAISDENDFKIKIGECTTNCCCFDDEVFEVGDFSILCLTPIQFFNKPQKYYEMLDEVKRVCLYFKEYYL